jgi:hypothetical protein
MDIRRLNFILTRICDAGEMRFGLIMQERTYSEALMLFLIMMAIPYIAPIIGYYLIFKKLEWEQYTRPSFTWALISLLLVHCLPAFVFLCLVLNMYLNSVALILMTIWGCVAPLSIKLYLSLSKQSPTQKAKTTPYPRGKQVLAIGLMLIVSFTPHAAYTAYTSSCYHDSTLEARPFIEALEAYHEAHGSYPPDFDSLFPNPYEIPVSTCVAEIYDNDGYPYPVRCCRPIWAGQSLIQFFDGYDSIEPYLLVWYFGLYFDECACGLQ